MKKYFISTAMLITMVVNSQVTNFGDLQVDGEMGIHTSLVNEGKINSSALLVSVEGSYFQFEEVNSEYITLSGDQVRVTLNGNPIEGIHFGEYITMSDSNVTEWFDADDYQKIRVGKEIVKTQIFDIRGRYLGENMEQPFQEGIYIIVSYYSDGSKTSKKIKL